LKVFRGKSYFLKVITYSLLTVWVSPILVEKKTDFAAGKVD